MRRTTSSLLGFTIASLVVTGAAGAQTYAEKRDAELATAVTRAKVSLGKGLSASAREGRPISGKFEIEDGKFQLSVYTAKGDKFFEVIVDHKTGKIAKVEPITGGEDLTAAKAQSQAIATAKRSLRAAVATALKANNGYRAVSVIPALKDGHPVAEVTLVKGEEFKTVSEKLD
jgi:hypothetical protein